MGLLTVTTANICGLPLRPLPAVRARVEQAAAFGGVVFGQELALENPGYRETWRDVMSRERRHTYGRTEDVIAVPVELLDVEHATIHVHDGLANVSPARFITQVTGTLPTGERVAFLNCHPVSKPRWGVTHARWRIAHHQLYLARLAQHVRYLHLEHRTVVYGGDMNATARKLGGWRVHAGQVQLVGRGLDHLWVLPAAGYDVAVHSRDVVRRTRLMDHPILSATLELTPRQPSPRP